MAIDKPTLSRLMEEAAEGEPEHWMLANDLDPTLMMELADSIAHGWITVMPELVAEGDPRSALVACVLTSFQIGWMAAQAQEVTLQ